MVSIQFGSTDKQCMRIINLEHLIIENLRVYLFLDKKLKAQKQENMNNL